MAIEKLIEFAKDGQKNTDDLNLTDGFHVSKKPARQWFNWLFNSLTSKVNEIIDADFVPKADIVDNLTTDDAKKPVSSKQAKNLQDNKLDKTANAVSATKLKNARKINTIDFDGSQDINIEAPLRWVGQISTPDQLNSAVLDGKYTVWELDVAGIYGYGVLVVLRNGGLCHQIYYPHLGSSLNNATMAMRQTWNMNGDIASWSEWRVVGTRDDSKLPLAGGTLTGDLMVNGTSNFKSINATGEITIDKPEVVLKHKLSGRYLYINNGDWGVYSPQGSIPLPVPSGGTGNLEGRAPSADRLATPRNIFGQTFDGSGDVGGTITASTGLVQSDNFHYIDLGRATVDRMNFYNFNATFNFIDSQNGNVVARITHNGIDCNAASASKLKTPRKINGVDFDASTDINLPLIGIGQTWQDVSALRLDGVTYTNTSPRTITVFFGGGRHGVIATEFYVNDEIYASFGGSESDEVFFSIPIPPGGTYGYKNKPQYSYVFRELK